MKSKPELEPPQIKKKRRYDVGFRLIKKPVKNEPLQCRTIELMSSKELPANEIRIAQVLSRSKLDATQSSYFSDG